MRINELMDSSYIMGLSESVLLTENMKSIISDLSDKVHEIETMISTKSKSTDDIYKEIKKLLDTNVKVYAAIRTILSVDNQLRKKEVKAEKIDEYTILVQSFYNLLLNGSVEDVTESMIKFYEKYVKENIGITSTMVHFEKSLYSDLRQSDRSGVRGVAVLTSLHEYLKDMTELANLYFRDNNPANIMAKNAGKKPQTVKEAIDTIFEFMDALVEQGLYEFETLFKPLTESEGQVSEDKPYYAIVTGQVEIDGKKHRNIKSTLVTKAPDAITALKNIKKDLRSSVSSINKDFKKAKAKLNVDINDNIKIMTYDEIKKKNIDNLVGSSLVSRGFVVLKGTMDNGNISPEAEYAPMSYTFLNKSSVTRYLNKDR